MDEARFATWKYQHAGAGYRSRARLIWAAVFFAGALTAFRLPPLAIGLLIASLVLFFTSTKKIFVGPRYLICGQTIVYYNNVVRMTLEEGSGVLSLVTAANQTFVLERDKFPTNARKADKIKKNKASKFAKVSANLIAKVLRAVPQVETSGISAATYASE